MNLEADIALNEENEAAALGEAERATEKGLRLKAEHEALAARVSELGRKAERKAALESEITALLGEVRAAESFVAEILSRFESPVVARILAGMGLTAERIADGVDALNAYLDGLEGSELARQVLRFQPVVSAILRGDHGAGLLETLAISGISGLVGLSKREQGAPSAQPPETNRPTGEEDE